MQVDKTKTASSETAFVDPAGLAPASPRYQLGVLTTYTTGPTGPKIVYNKKNAPTTDALFVIPRIECNLQCR